MPVLLHAKVSHDVGVFVGLAEKFHLAVGDAEARVQNTLHSYVAVVEPAPAKQISNEGKILTL